MNIQKRFVFLIKISLYFLTSTASWSWAQTPFDFSEIKTSSTVDQKQGLSSKYPLIPLRRVYKNEEYRGVYYFNSLEQKNAKVIIKNGLFYKVKKPNELVNRDIPPPLLLPKITPPPPVDKAKRLGYAIFVLDQTQTLYLTFKAQQGRIHHSSLLAGRDVICAGEMQIFQGQLKYINNRSGHYQPPPKSLKLVLRFLKEQGVKLEKVKVEFLGVDL